MKDEELPRERRANRFRGIGCPKCGCRMSEVLDTRKALRNYISRRRQCRHCGFVFSTVELAKQELPDQGK